MTGMHMYNIYHIIFVILFILYLTIQIILTKKYKPNSKAIDIYTKLLAVIIILGVTITRISNTVYNVRRGLDNYKWYFFLPDTWCSLVGIVYSLNLLFFKRNQNVLHYTAFAGFLGGIMAILVPNFLNKMSFFSIRSFPSFIYHGAMILVTVFLIQTEEFKPTIKKANYFMIGMAASMVFGSFEKRVMHMNKPMQINDPFFTSTMFLRILTGWPMVILGELIFVVITCLIFDHRNNKKVLVFQEPENNNLGANV
ncbi:MAG: YwaF family protein [Acholeplasmatales bacterium]|nr:YwaF family protein [Acholeplasmatales bacterium]